MNTQYIRLNMVPAGVLPVMHTSQFDIGRPLGVVVYDGSAEMDLDDYTVTIEATRTDGTPITAAVTTDGNVGAFVTTATMTNKDDLYPAQLVIVDGDSNRVASLPFMMRVVKAAMDENSEAIEEDAPLYQQYNAAIQALIVAVRADLNVEVAARQAADTTLQTNINAEASTRSTQDALLQTQINQIIAPTGTAPSAAEIENARIGADGVTYQTLGEAIRTNDTELRNQLDKNIGSRLTNIDGIEVPSMELGTIAMSSSSIVFNSSTTVIRTPQTGGIPVTVGAVIHLTDYTNAKFKYCILKDSDGKYTYTSAWLTADYRVANTGVLYLLLTRTDGATITNVSSLSSLVRINKHDGDINDVSNQILMLNNHENIIENNSFASALFANGDISDGILLPTTRVYRVSTVKAITLSYDLYVNVNAGFKIALYEYLNNAWVRRGGSSSWLTRFSISKGTKFAFCIAKTTEDTSSTADVNEFVLNLVVYSNLTNQFLSNVEASQNAINEYMAHFYASGETEAYCFFTDPHLMGQAGGFDEGTFNNYMGTLEAVVKQTSAAYVVSGGDWLNREDTKAQAAVKLGYVDGKMRAMFPDRYYPIVGNHDFNYIGYEDGSRLPEADWVSNGAMRNFWFHDHEQCYYKFKVMTAQNYVLNTRTDYDGTNSYDKTMLDWLAANLIEDDAPHSTIMFHIYFLSAVGTTIPTRVTAIGKMIAAFNAHSTCVLTNDSDGYDKTYDFTGTTGHIDYVIVGHTHADFSDTFGGVPVVGCDNFTEGNVATFDMVFADYTNHKLYLTRFGSGESREFDI